MSAVCKWCGETIWWHEHPEGAMWCGERTPTNVCQASPDGGSKHDGSLV